MKLLKQNQKSIFLLAIAAIFIGGGLFFLSQTSAFEGPTQSAGFGSGRIRVDTNRNLGISTSTFTVNSNAEPFSTTSSLNIFSGSYPYTLNIVDSGGIPAILVRTSGGVSFGTSTDPVSFTPLGSSGVKKVAVSGAFLANSIQAYNVTSTIINGTLMNTVSANQVTAGVFNSVNCPACAASYAFPENGSVGIATSTQVGLPQTLSVYGGGYFSGNVGIGTALPDYPLHIVSVPTSGQTISLYVDNQNNQFSTSIGIASKAYDNVGAYYDYDFYGQGPATLFAGNVGIGTTVGQNLGSNMLTVSGTSMFGNSTTTQIRWKRTGSTFGELISPVGGGRVGISAKNVAGGSGGGLSFYVSPSTADTLAMTIIDSGDVGINTLNPLYKLDVMGTFGAATSTFTGQINTASSGIKFNDGTVQTTSPLGAGSGSTGRVVFWQSTTTLGYDSNFFWDNNNKRLGIGTTAPLRPLDIVGDGSNELIGFAKSDGARKWNIGIKAYASPYDGLNFAETGVSNYVLFLEPGGNVGIGTGNPGSKLSVSGNVTIGSGYSDPSNPRSAPTDGLIIEGTVGIGTYSPNSSYKLDVTGNTLVTGSSTVTGTTYLNGNVNLGDTGGWAGDKIYLAGSIASYIYFAGPTTGTGNAASYGIVGASGGTGGNGGNITIMAGGADMYQTGGSLYLQGGGGSLSGSAGDAGNVYVDTLRAAGSGGGNIIFRTSPQFTFGVERMRVNRSGNVGIGTTAPGALLEIATSSASAFRIKKTAGTAGSVDLFVAVSTTSVSPSGACTAIIATAQCLSGWNPQGSTNIGCAGAAAIGNRALCADFGD